MAVTDARGTQSASTRPTGAEPPAALQVVLVVALSCALGYAIVDAPLALVNQFTAPVVLLAATACACGCAYVWFRAIRPLGRSRVGVATILAFSVVAVITGINVAYASQNVVQDRDPGAYIDSAQWFAHHGNFFLDGLVGPFAQHAQQLFVAGAGFQAGAPGGRIYPQFLHVLPAFLAGANWIGGPTLMFATNALLGGLALLAFYAFARTWLSENLAAIAVVLLAVNPIQVLHSRNTYSEILTQVFLFGGLWALAEADRVDRVSLYAIAGLLLGATGMVRIDAFLFLIPLTVIATVRLWRAQTLPDSQAARVRRTVLAAGAGVLVTCALGVFDGVYFSRPYIDDNKGFLLEIAAALILTVAGCAVALAVHRRRSQALLSRRVIAILGTTAALLIIAGFAWAWFVRPHTQTGYQMARPVGGIFDLRFPALPAKIRIRTYSEFTVPRLALFVGAVTLIGGVLGAAFVARRVISDPSDPRLPFLLLFAGTTALYVWQPSIAGDMVWFLRRFLPITIPGLILFSMVIAHELLQSRTSLAKAGAVLLVIGGLAFPLAQLPDYLFHRSHAHLATGLEQTCTRLGNHAAIVVVQSSNVVEGPQYRYPQALQAFCRVPVATAPPGLGPAFYSTLASEWKQQGRQLVVVADRPEALSAVVGDAQPLQQSDYRVLQRTYHHRPTKYEREQLDLFFKPVPADAGT